MDLEKVSYTTETDDANEVIYRKLREHFDGKIVRKDLTKAIKEGANVPVYVLEFLLGQYCSSDDPKIIEGGMKNVKRILSENFVRPDEAQKVLSSLRERGSYTVIDRITVNLNIKLDRYEADFSDLGVRNIPTSSDYVSKYDRLLCGGIWCIVGLAPIQTGDAVITPGFGLPTKFVVHTAGPVYRGGKNGEEEQLRLCYINSLKRAVENKCESIAFPLISSGIYGYPKDEALRVATNVIQDFLVEHELEVYLAVFDKEAFAVSEKLLGEVESYIDEHYVVEHKYTRRELLDE